MEYFINVPGCHTFQLCLDLWGSKYFIGGPYISFQEVHIFQLLHEKLVPVVHFMGGVHFYHDRHNLISPWYESGI